MVAGNLIGGALSFGYLALRRRGLRRGGGVQSEEGRRGRAPVGSRREELATGGGAASGRTEFGPEARPSIAASSRVDSAPTTRSRTGSWRRTESATKARPTADKKRRGRAQSAATPDTLVGSRDGRKRSLILAGGGIRAAWQAGAMRALADAGVVFRHVDGTSSGVLNLAMLLSGLSPQEICDRWRTLPVKDFLSFAASRKPEDLLDVEALGDAEALVHRVLPHLGVDVRAIRLNRQLEGTFNVCDFARKVNEVIPHKRVDLDLLVAAVSPPVLMPPVNRDGTLYTDSLWIQDGNLMEAVRRGAEVIWVLWCIGNTPRYGRGLLQQYTHLMELSANGALFEQLERVREINERILAGEEVFGHRRPIAVHLVKPERPLPLDTDVYDGRVTTDSLIDMGYSDTWRYLTVRGEQGLPLTPEMTLTTEPAPDLTFRESITGPFALGPTDPMAGALHPDARPLTLHLTIGVDDVDAFVSDIRHTARLVARIRYAPFGDDIPVRLGSFNLFQSREDARTRLMTYGLRFAHEGREYFLEGTRAVRYTSAATLWKDTTRLLCELHEGPDARGPVVGAGVLSLGVAQILEVISSMHPARQGSAGLSAMDRFGRFFLGPLWDRYAPAARPHLASELAIESPGAVAPPPPA
ncbi:patatin-like phospholipase family protein [Pyxidicoccus parkwayensis]|uniref:Patatin-like phospholipase family protein n=2 Tax=Pyxidicoccus parkwayensis TaxID=2813578 RepID=A0ABX7PCI1_9BACT|nr:patatin-like phospholipase family protein [Pyxidicoccus parkwaysis]